MRGRALHGRAGALLVATCVLLRACALSRAGSLDASVDHYMRGQYEKAIYDADLALATGTPSDADRARANLIKAQSYEKLGDRDAAVGLYRYVAERFPGTPEAYQAGERLRRLERAGGGSAARGPRTSATAAKAT